MATALRRAVDGKLDSVPATDSCEQLCHGICGICRRQYQGIRGPVQNGGVVRLEEEREGMVRAVDEARGASPHNQAR